MTDRAGTAASRDGQELERQLIDIVARLADEIRPGSEPARSLSPTARLDRDLGLDSMARAELMVRIEQAFAVELPDSVLSEDTVEGLARAVKVAQGQSTPRRAPAPVIETAATAGLPEQAATLTASFDWHLDAHPDRAHLYLYDGDGRTRRITYAGLDGRAWGVARGLSARSVNPRQTVALMLPTGEDYFAAFLGILRRGAVPVPIYPPARASQLEEHLRRHGRILANAGTRVLITVPRARRLAGLLRAEAPFIRHIVTVGELAAGRADVAAVSAAATDLALLQYTSGSTGDPKGVMLTHADLLANIRAMGQRLGVTSSDVFASWLPLYHDMGLIAAWLGSLYFAIPLAAMSPLGFLGKPLRWLEMIHRHRATISGGPNFGYELCLRALDSQLPVEGLDLSSWRVAFNGAEPVSPDTLERFAERLAPYGLGRDALMPVYGLAEVGVGLCVPRPGRGPVFDRVGHERFASSGQAAAPGPGEPTLTFVSCGRPLPGYEVRIVDVTGHERPERQEGDIEFRGPSATAGYFDNPDATRELLHYGWLRTGDRGYMAAGDLYITGRVKDVIIRGGRNVYPYDLEAAVGRIPGVRKGCVAAFGCADAASGIERLVIVAETRAAGEDEQSRVREAIRDASLDVMNLPADDVLLVPPHSILKTSSGKIRRSATCELYRAGRLGAPRGAVWWQGLRLAWEAATGSLSMRLRALGEWLYAAYAWCLFAPAALAAWVAALVLPYRSWRWSAARGIARGAALLAGIDIEVRGIENLPLRERCILVSNHASYIDALVLTAALPRAFCYLAKKELSRRFFARVLLRRMGAIYVERFDPREASSDARQVERVIAAGESVAFFPEGTFSRGYGVGAFHMGAFVAAARSGSLLVPVALRGTRSLLRGSEWFPRPGRVRVSVGRPLTPRDTGWAEAVRLRDESRRYILRECGEPDLMG